MVYLGIKLIVAEGSTVDSDSTTADARSGWALYRDGVATELLNPKSALFYATVLPQFVDARRPDVRLQIFVCGLIFIACACLSATAITLTAAAARARLVRNAVWQAATRRVSGLILVALGVRLAFVRAR